MNPFEISVRQFDMFAGEYAGRFKNVDAYKHSLEKFCMAIGKTSPSLLDLACGPGNFTRYLRQWFPGSSCLAIDLAPNMLEIARSHLSGVDFRLMDIRDISGLQGKFDAIICSFGLPFLTKTEAEKLISDCTCLLVQGGAFYLSTMEGDESRAGFETTSFSGTSEIYFNYHRQSDLEKALVNNGFSVLDMRKQDYIETDDSVLVDMIFVALKR